MTEPEIFLFFAFCTALAIGVIALLCSKHHHEEKPDKPEIRHCKYCGKEFAPTKKCKVYCAEHYGNNAVKQAAYRRNKTNPVNQCGF